MTRKQQIEYLTLFSLILVGWGTLGAVFFTKLNDIRVQSARKYLSEAQKSSNDSDKFLLYEQAAALNPNQESYLGAGIAALKLGDNRLAQKYLGRVKTAAGYYQLGNAYFGLGNYQPAVAAFRRSTELKADPGAYLALGKSYLKLGDVTGANVALGKSAEMRPDTEASQLLKLLIIPAGIYDRGNAAVYSYNELGKLGYPQVAQKLLTDAAIEGHLTRDGLLSLVNTKIQDNDYEGAYQYLLTALSIDPYYPQTYQQLILVSDKLGETAEAKEYRQQLGRFSL